VSEGGVSPRVRSLVAAEYGPSAGEALERLESLRVPFLGVPNERIVAAVLALARGDVARLEDACARAARDWRDVLVWAGFANGDWRERVDAYLGPS
jgi:hypothetical protein